MLCSLLRPLLLVVASAVTAAHGHSCKNIPGDPNWPVWAEWDALNKTIGGKLISTVPLASVCHSEGEFALYNETACAALQTRWDWSQVQ